MNLPVASDCSVDQNVSWASLCAAPHLLPLLLSLPSLCFPPAQQSPPSFCLPPPLSPPHSRSCDCSSASLPAKHICFVTEWRACLVVIKPQSDVSQIIHYCSQVRWPTENLLAFFNRLHIIQSMSPFLMSVCSPFLEWMIEWILRNPQGLDSLRQAGERFSTWMDVKKKNDLQSWKKKSI